MLCRVLQLLLYMNSIYNWCNWLGSTGQVRLLCCNSRTSFISNSQFISLMNNDVMWRYNPVQFYFIFVRLILNCSGTSIYQGLSLQCVCCVLCCGYQQSQLACYPEAKIQEHHDAVDRLRREHTAYLHKLRALDSDCKSSNWANRPYKRLHGMHMFVCDTAVWSVRFCM